MNDHLSGASEASPDIWTHRVKLPERYTTKDLKRAEDIMGALRTLDIQFEVNRRETRYWEEAEVEYHIEPLTIMRRIHKQVRV